MARRQHYVQVFAHGAHGTQCYILLRGLARDLHPHEHVATGTIHYTPHADLGPGDVRSLCTYYNTEATVGFVLGGGARRGGAGRGGRGRGALKYSLAVKTAFETCSVNEF